MTKGEASSSNATATQFVQSSIPLPPKLELKGNLADNWKKFKRLWTNYEIASHLRSQNHEMRTATLLTCIGPDVLDIYDGLPFKDEAEKNNIDKVIELLEKHCVGETNEIYERYVFNKRDQESGESFDSYLTVLRSLAKTCNFGDLRDNLLRDRIVIGIRDNGTRKKLLAESKLTLEKCIHICRAHELTAKQLKEMTQTGDVSAISTSRRPQRRAPNNNKGTGPAQGRPTPAQPAATLIKCKFCSKSHPKKKEMCPAWQKKCKDCGQNNHFAGSAVCKHKAQNKRTVHGVNDESLEEEDSYFFYVESVGSVSETECQKRIFATMRLEQQEVKFQLDCGATVNILPADIYQSVFRDPSLAKLQKTKIKLQMFNKTELKPIGTIVANTLNPKNREKHKTEYVIVPKGHMSILGSQAIQQFNLMSINVDNILSVLSKVPAQPDNPELIAEFNDVFEGDGKLDDVLHLEVDNTVTPVALPVRKIALALREPLKQELDRLTDKGILQPVEVPTDWVSSMVVAEKRNGKIRLCIDPKPLNKALKRNHYPLPVVDDLLPKLTNARVFTVVDAKNGFWHVQLDQESSFLTTFGTPWGRYRWTRMPFGISVAPEEFQRRLDNALEGLDGVEPIFDDILVFGTGESDAEALADHDAKLRALFQRCREKGIKLNKEKLKLRRTEVSFMGHTISKDGLKPDPAKLQGIQDMPSPQNKQDVKRFLGMVNYLQRYAPNLSDVTSPLRDLLKETNQFRWDSLQEQSFKRVKQIISEAPVLKYFNASDSVEIQCDASNRGLGACLMQNGQPIAYASRSMTETEANYAQIEKEMLAIVFSVERFEQYVYGRPVSVQTDHKPLEFIYKKSLISAPKRLQRMLLRLQKFDLTLTYKKGSEMVLADTLSRAYGETTIQGDTEQDSEVIHMIHYLPVTEATRTAIQHATETDAAMKELKSTIRNGWPLTKDEVPTSIREYFPFRDEMTMQDGIVIKGERIVIPTSLRAEMLTKIHASHIGIQGCLRRAREVLYWPGMNNDVEQYVSRCETCNKYPNEQGKEPMISHEIPSRPWEKVATDLFHLENKDFLITVDYYSNYFEVDKLASKTAKEVIGKLKSHFARHGIPDQVISDNGPPYSSAEFQEFARAYAFDHVTSSPTYPQSNGKVENAVNTAQKLMTKASETQSDPYLALLDWRNTPSEGINASPAQRIFGRRTKTLLPTSTQLLKPKLPENINQRLREQKAKQTYYYNRGAKELQELHPGDTVRIAPPRSLGGRKAWTKAEVGRQVDIRSYEVRTEDGRVFRRNRRQLRLTNEAMKKPIDEPLPPPLPPPSKPQQPPDPVTKQNSLNNKTTVAACPAEPAHAKPPGAPVVTRSGRVIRPPDRFQ